MNQVRMTGRRNKIRSARFFSCNHNPRIIFYFVEIFLFITFEHLNIFFRQNTNQRKMSITEKPHVDFVQIDSLVCFFKFLLKLF